MEKTRLEDYPAAISSGEPMQCGFHPEGNLEIFIGEVGVKFTSEETKEFAAWLVAEVLRERPPHTVSRCGDIDGRGDCDNRATPPSPCAVDPAVICRCCPACREDSK